MTEDKHSCVEPSKGPIGVSDEDTAGNTQPQNTEEVYKMVAQVGKAAPDFEANAYLDGGFKNIKLSDYKGQWVSLCFYPGDFTFV